MRCPVCSTEFEVKKVMTSKGEAIEAYVDPWLNMNVLIGVVKNYHRWVAEGYPKFGGISDVYMSQVGEKDGEQIYYDDQNVKIIYDNKNNTYRFDILTLLSRAKGVTHWVGKFKMDRGGKICLIKDNSEYFLKEDRKLKI